MASKATEYYSSILPVIDLDKNVVAKELIPVSPTSIRYYTVNAVGTTTGNSGSSGFVFNIIPPSSDAVMSRLIRIRLTFQVQVSGNLKSNIFWQGWNVINSAYTGFCAFPINSCFSTLDLQINNISTSIRPSQVIQDLLRYDDPKKLIEGTLSESPCMMDPTSDYAMITNFMESPFGSFGDHDYSRNAFNINFINPNNPGATGNPQAPANNEPPAQAIFQATFTEPLIIPPLVYTEDWFHYTGFGQLNAVSINITIDSNALGRVFRQARNDPVQWTGSPTVTIVGTPQLIVGWYTLNPSQKIPPILNYKFSNIVNYVTQSSTAITQSTITGAQPFVITSNAIQLTSIPRAVMISVTKQGKTYQDPDFYYPFGIQQPRSAASAASNIINITFNNETGILSTAAVEDLYIIARKNGLNMSYSQFSGAFIQYYNGQEVVNAPTSQYIVTTGSGNQTSNSLFWCGSGGPLLLLFGVDIPIGPDDYVGKKGYYSFQVTVNCINPLVNPTYPPNNSQIINPDNGNNRPQLNLIVIYDGWLRIENGIASFDVGIPDGYKPMSLPRTVYPKIDHLLRGGGLQAGSLFGTLGKIVKSIPIVGDILGGLFGDDEEEQQQQQVQPVYITQPQYAPQQLRTTPKALPAPKTGGHARSWRKYQY
jgi:hypothetical protein